MSFQSPFNRGKDCNLASKGSLTPDSFFQSPFNRGKDCNILPSVTIAWQKITFQSPFNRGKDCNKLQYWRRVRFSYSFQSPFNRGKDCNIPAINEQGIYEIPFSPLLIGARIVTISKSDNSPLISPFSPLLIGARIVTGSQTLRLGDTGKSLSVPF